MARAGISRGNDVRHASSGFVPTNAVLACRFSMGGELKMARELVFYTNPMSRGRIVRWMLEELGEPYRTEVLGFGPPMKSKAYLAVNPMGKVPALKHGDWTVTEAAAICAYLADAFPDAELAPPADDRRRAPYYRWMFFAAGPLEQAATNKTFGFTVPPDREGLAGGAYVLIHPEQIVGVVAPLDFGKPAIVAAIDRLHPVGLIRRQFRSLRGRQEAPPRRGLRPAQAN